MLLNEIRNRGFLNVGTDSSVNADGSYAADFNTDLGKAIAAAVFGDANKIKFVPVAFEDSFTSVANGDVDLVSSGVTQNLNRDGSLDIDFAPTYLYDYQAILVSKKSQIHNILELEGKTIGTLKGTTASANLASILTREGIKFTAQVFASNADMIAAYNQGKVDAISSDRTALFSSLNQFPDPDNHLILDTELSKQPLALVIPENDSEWGDVVKWTTYALVQGEEFGITSANIDDIIANTTNPQIRRFLGLEDNLGEKLGLPKDFVVKIIKQVGNYGEIYERNFPGLERDRSNLWTNDGLLYSSPFAGSTNFPTLESNDGRDLFKEVQERGSIKLGVTGKSPGFAVQQDNGEWIGFDIELGKAVAAAIFGDPSKLEITIQKFADGFTNVANGVVDISAMGVTQNLARDADLGVDFSPAYIYTGQGILVRQDSGISFLSDLNGRTIGLTSSSTGLQNLQDAFAEIGGSFTPQLFTSTTEMFAAYDRGELDAVSTDQTIIAGRVPTLSNPDEHQLLDAIVSKEPLSLVIDENQSQFADIIRWVTQTLVQAEELGISSKNIDQLIADNIDDAIDNDSSSEIRTFLGLEENIGKSLGLPKNFAVNVIRAVGNYAEMYERNFNPEVLSRGENQLYTNYGLQYSAPFTPATNEPGQIELQNPLADLAENSDTTKMVKVADITVTDDAPNDSNLTLTGADAELFEINDQKLFLKAGTKLDFETSAELNLTVELDDPTIKGKPDSQSSLSIEIIDVNEIPQIELQNVLKSLAENSDTTNKIKVADIAITDASPNPSNLTLTGADAELFEIIDQELFLKAGTKLDFETSAELNLTVELDDPTIEGKPDSQSSISIEITDVNETPVFAEDLIRSLTISENQPPDLLLATIRAKDNDKNENLVYAITTGNLDVDQDGQLAFAIASDTGKITVNDGDDLNYETNPNFALKITATDSGSNQITTDLTIKLTDIQETKFKQLTTPGIFNLTSDADLVDFKFDLVNLDSNLVNHLALFTVDDEQGNINGISTNSTEYLAAALQRSKPLFSMISNPPVGLSANTQYNELLTVNSALNFGLVLTQDTTIADAQLEWQNTGHIKDHIFLSTDDNLLTENTETEGLRLTWQNLSATGNSDNLTIDLHSTTPTTDNLIDTLEIQSASGDREEINVVDLRNFTNEAIDLEVEVFREADFNNTLGFYAIDNQGRVVDSLTGDVLSGLPETANYQDIALANRIQNVELNVADDETKTTSFALKSGLIYAPFLIVDGTFADLDNINSTDSPAVYFSMIEANSDGANHFTSLGDNMLGVEDISGGGDQDFQDLVIAFI